MKSRLFLLCFLVVISACSTTSSSRKERKHLSSLKGRVIIDAGHGGEDSGAVGARGLKEKDVTLDIAKRLGRLFSRMMPNVHVVFTRTDDRYVSLEDRVLIANKTPADVFVSLHINSSESKEASGFEIFSLDIASDRHAERLAAQENKSPKKNAGGVDIILADLRANSYRLDSDRLAKAIAHGLKNQARHLPSSHAIVDRGYNQAIFHVLFVKMPAVITELFFISNPKEEELLSKQNSREYIARGIFLGVREFFVQNAKVKHASR